MGGKQTRGVWKMFWRAPYSTSVRLLGLHRCKPKHKLGNAVSNGVCLHCEELLGAGTKVQVWGERVLGETLNL